MKLTSIYRRLRRILDPALPKATVNEFKTKFWQSDAGASVFTEGSDANHRPYAAIMDAVINEFFLEQCPPASKILDLGCGHGIVSVFLAQHGHSIVACDVSKPLLSALSENKNGLDIEIREGDAHHIPAAEDEFDVIVARMFLPHFPDWPSILREMARCCRPGGRLLIHFTSKENAAIARRMGEHDCEFATSPVLNWRQVNPFTFFAEADQLEIDKVCRKLGLRVLKRAPNTFFLHNRLIGHSLGTSRYQIYQEEIERFFQKGEVREFVIWFEKNAVQHLPVWMTYYNVLVVEKL